MPHRRTVPLLYARTVSSDDEARSTERPPATGDDEDNPHPDIAAAILRAKSNAARNSAAPTATAKINKFDLAHALALTTSDDEPTRAFTGGLPPLDDDGPLVGATPEGVGTEGSKTARPGPHSGVPTNLPVPQAAVEPPPPPAPVVVMTPMAVATPIRPEAVPPLTPPQTPGSTLILALVAGAVLLVVIAYVLLSAR